MELAAERAVIASEVVAAKTELAKAMVSLQHQAAAKGQAASIVGVLRDQLAMASSPERPGSTQERTQALRMALDAASPQRRV